MNLALIAVLAIALLLFGAISRKAEQSAVTPAMVFVLLGLALGPPGLGWLGAEPGTDAIRLLAELTLVLVLFTDAARIDLVCLRREESLPARLLGIGFPLTIAAGALAGALLLPDLGLWGWLLLAAILAPTDAALGQAVVSIPHVPLRIRQTLNVESGLNDGIAFPVVLVLASLADTREAGEGLAYWARFAALQVTLGPLVGVAVGYLGGQLIERGTHAGWISGAFERLSVLGLAALAFAGAELVGGNGFIAAFSAGLTLGNSARSICGCLYEFGEAEGQLLALVVFFLFGAVMVPAALPQLDAATAVYVLLCLTAVRMLPVALSLLGSGLRPGSYAFLGWFGPRGLASIIFALLVVEESPLAGATRIEGIVSLAVLLSTFAHGLTAYPLAQRYGRLMQEQTPEAEHREAPDMPLRCSGNRAPLGSISGG